MGLGKQLFMKAAARIDLATFKTCTCLSYFTS